MYIITQVTRWNIMLYLYRNFDELSDVLFLVTTILATMSLDLFPFPDYILFDKAIYEFYVICVGMRVHTWLHLMDIH